MHHQASRSAISAQIPVSCASRPQLACPVLRHAHWRQERPLLAGVTTLTASTAAAQQPCRAHRPSIALRSTALDAPAVVQSEPESVSPAASVIIQYAINLARTSETYEVHSWMLLLGILKSEKCTAARVLQSLGLDDLYGAWHEVLWALQTCDGLTARSFTPEISFADRAFKIITASSDFAAWHAKDTVYSEDLLMGLAAGGVLEGLFPDLNLTFERVRKAVEKETGRRYELPGDDDSQPPALASEDQIF